MRIVSLVPSISELIADFGLLSDLVGRTRYCVEPAGRIDAVEAVGGTKNPDIDRILALQPDLVVMSAEENRREDYQRLEREGVRVHVVHPRTVVGAAEMIEELGGLVGALGAASVLARRCRAAVEESMTQAADAPIDVFCPIWRRPWMTFGGGTYAGDVLRVCGFRNVFESDSRDFFEVSLEQVIRCRPRVVLLPDEPYRFTASHAAELACSGLEACCFSIDGRDLSWYGPRIPGALVRLRAIRREIAG